MAIRALAFIMVLHLLAPDLVQGTCGGLQGDVVFLLDASGSVGSSNFQTMLTFVSDLVDDFDIGSDLVRVGVIAYASSVNPAFDLDAYSTKATVKNAVMSVVYTGGGTNTAGALQYMTSTMFTSASGDRSTVPNIGIVITDGFSNSYSSTASWAAQARANGITLFAIGIGTGVSELNAIASDPDSYHVFTVSSFTGLANVKSYFQGSACSSNVLQLGNWGGWGSWGSWGSCSSLSGSGTQTRTRLCDNPAPTNGASCYGSAQESTTCTGSSSESSTESSSGSSTAAIAGGVVGGLAAVGLGAAAFAVYTKFFAGKTAVSSMQSTGGQGNANNGQESNNNNNDNNNDNDNDNDNNDDQFTIPGVADAPPSIQPMDTRLPVRLPPIIRI